MVSNIYRFILFRDFITGVHRDSYASHIGHFSRLAYMSVAENESIAKTRFKLLEVSINISHLNRKWFSLVVHPLLRKMMSDFKLI
jgi:hypothetical protein